jgi:hypothetical protein
MKAGAFSAPPKAKDEGTAAETLGRPPDEFACGVGAAEDTFVAPPNEKVGVAVWVGWAANLKGASPGGIAAGSLARTFVAPPKVKVGVAVESTAPLVGALDVLEAGWTANLKGASSGGIAAGSLALTFGAPPKEKLLEPTAAGGALEELKGCD